MKSINFLSTICALCICFSAGSHAQEAVAVELKTRPFQLSFVTPIGTNGWDSWSVINKFSLNLLAGYAGGVNGAEFSGFGSVLRTNMNGAQFSGFGNIVLGETRGAQFAGFLNLSVQEAYGAQVAGFANINTGKKMHGAQVAGFSNINTGESSGLQLAGFFNYTKVLSGAQVGILNYADSSEGGVPIGLLSFVKNGYRAYEISANESLYGVSSFKTGTRSFYNILSVGGGYRNKRSLFAWGWGMGTIIAVAEKLDIAIEGQGLHVNEDEWFTSGTNLLAKASVSLTWNIAEHFSIFCGPSWNVVISKIKHENGSAIAPWSVFDKTTEGGTNIKMYPGLSAGLRF